MNAYQGKYIAFKWLIYMYIHIPNDKDIIRNLYVYKCNIYISIKRSLPNKEQAPKTDITLGKLLQRLQNVDNTVT